MKLFVFNSVHELVREKCWFEVRPGIGMEVEATAEHPAEHRLGHFGEEIRIHDKPAEKIRG